MEIRYDNSFNEYFTQLWRVLKKFRVGFTICVFITFFLVDLFFTALAGMGSPTGHISRSGNEIAEALYPLLLFAGAVIASLAMWDFGATAPASVLPRRVGIAAEWFARWLIYVLLPFLFMLLGIYLMDIFIAGSNYGIIPLEAFGIDDLCKAYAFPTYFFVVSLYFLGATYFKRYSLVATSLVAGLSGYALLLILPRRIWYTSAPYEPSWFFIAFLIIIALLAFVLSYFNLCVLRKGEKTAVNSTSAGSE